MIKKIKDYAKRLCEEDAKIEEIVLIGSFANGTANDKSDVDLICVFPEELEDDSNLHIILRDRVQTLKRKLVKLEDEIGRFIDLGFIASTGDIFIFGGLIGNYGGKYKTLVKRSEVNHTKKEVRDDRNYILEQKRKVL